ncbi:MAG: glycoside hydrolase family 9 protein [Planctomycetes bacterium]|nr:glycoside hydrolase family 9 protein [Planctomycetota bacterium]
MRADTRRTVAITGLRPRLALVVASDILCLMVPASRAWALDVLVNQAGYESNGPKTVRAQRSTDFAGDGTFSVRKASDNTAVYSGTLSRKGGLWDKYYWEGDFSTYRIGGAYYITATVDADPGNSYGFILSPGVFQNVTGNLAFRYYTAQRCGSDVTDLYDGTHWHGPCHLDDGVRSDLFTHADAVGGWHDAGDYNKFPHGFAADGCFALLWLYDANRSYYDGFDLNQNGIPDIIDEARYQARWLAKMVDPDGHCLAGTRINRGGATFVRPEVDTNNTICNCSSMSSCDACDDRWVDHGDENTPQETVCCAALIRMHRVLASKGLPTENFAAKALSIWNHRVALAVSQGGHNNLGNSAFQIWAGLDLFAVFGQQDCYDRAVQCVASISNTVVANPAFYDSINWAEGPGYELGVLAWFARAYPAAPQAANAVTAVQTLMNHNIGYLAGDRVGLVRRDDGGTLQYFPTNPNNNGFFLGINRLYLLMAWGAIEAHKLINNPAHLRFAMDQYNWVLGSNYFKVCMVHGAGTFHPPSYHHRYTPPPGWPKGAEPGVVPNGIVRTYSTGLPQFDLSGTYPARYQTNECWLINNAAYAMALAGMTVFQDNAQIVSDTILTTMNAGMNYSVSVTVKNTSFLTWDSADYKLGAVDDSDPFAGGRQSIAGGTTVAPGQQYTFTFTMTAPATTGSYTTDWRMVHEYVNWFGDTLARQVQVVPRQYPGDFDHDGDVDASDFGHMQTCFSDIGLPRPPGCEDADFDSDGDVDKDDFNVFQRCFRGPGGTPGC